MSKINIQPKDTIEAEIREQMAAKDAQIKELRLELGRYMDAVDADGDGTVIE